MDAPGGRWGGGPGRAVGRWADCPGALGGGPPPSWQRYPGQSRCHDGGREPARRARRKTQRGPRARPRRLQPGEPFRSYPPCSMRPRARVRFQDFGSYEFVDQFHEIAFPIQQPFGRGWYIGLRYPKWSARLTQMDSTPKTLHAPRWHRGSSPDSSHTPTRVRLGTTSTNHTS